jgi:predicted DNA-binding antitoxin AbrB/MazE fold protein
MTITTEATYENGVLRPVRPLPLQEQQKVEVVIRTPPLPFETATTLAADERQRALQRLLALQLPVADWDQMEQEIVRGAIE